MPVIIRLGLLLFVLLLPATTHAQVRFRAEPVCSRPGYRAFDFWIGTWDAHDLAGMPRGRTVVTATNQGCTLRESWRDIFLGESGVGISAYDVTRDLWHHTWSEMGGSLLLLEGGSPEEGVIRLQGTRVRRGGGEVTERITWTRLTADRVRQHFETSHDGGRTWETSFEWEHRRVVP